MSLKTSCVKRVSNDTFIVIRAAYISICKGNVTAAALIAYFENWHNSRLEQREVARHENRVAVRHEDPATQIESLMHYHTMEDLEAALLGIGKRHSIEIARELLVAMGVVTLHKNPNPRYKFDNTTFYLFWPKVVNNLLNELPAIVENNERSPGEQVPPLAENSGTIPKDTPENTKKKVSAQSRGASVEEKKKKEEVPPRPHWNQMIDTWYEDYRGRKNGEVPTIAGRNLTHFGNLYELLEARAKRKGKTWTEEHATGSLKWYLNGAYKDTWLKDHWLLENLVKQFDAVVAREIAAGSEKVKKKTPPPTNEGPRAHIAYLVERYTEGNMDDRIVTELYYEHLRSLDLVTVEYYTTFDAPTREDQKRLAVFAWLKLQKPQA